MNDENNLKNDSNDENVLNQNSDEPLDISEDTGMNQQGTVDEHEEYASPKKEAANAQGEEQTEQSQDSPSFNINVEGDATFADNIYHKNGNIIKWVNEEGDEFLNLRGGGKKRRVIIRGTRKL